MQEYLLKKTKTMKKINLEDSAVASKMHEQNMEKKWKTGKNQKLLFEEACEKPEYQGALSLPHPPDVIESDFLLLLLETKFT